MRTFCEYSRKSGIKPPFCARKECNDASRAPGAHTSLPTTTTMRPPFEESSVFVATLVKARCDRAREMSWEADGNVKGGRSQGAPVAGSNIWTTVVRKNDRIGSGSRTIATQ